MLVSRARFASVTAVLVRLYAAGLLGLLVIRLGVGDATWWSFAINAFFLYAFLPLPFLALAVAFTRRAESVLTCALAAGVWLWFWGGLFVPRAARASSRPLVVLVYNVLGYNLDTADTVAVVRDSGADLVALQELNPSTAAALERELGDAYPYRWLAPQAGVTGGGLLSKHPFERQRAPDTGGPWVGEPMAIALDVHGKRMTVVRFHAFSGPGSYEERERQARAIAAYARSRKGPLIVAGDLNATDQNGAYAVIAEELRDAWREAGWGFGHTFPGRPTRSMGGARPAILRIPAPLWLLRIDYVFYSSDLVALDARMALDGGKSDHRGVVVTLGVP